MVDIDKNRKIAVATSGGVDSSVAAALLKKDGQDVVGVFMKLNDFSSGAEKRARKVAKVLKIPFKTFDFRKEFKKRIIDKFLEDYKNGITPNPCVSCNKEIKFGLLLEKSLKLGADFFATGHYSRLRRAGKKFKLLKGKDKKKDQSYFLWRLNKKQLKNIIFPVGNYTKTEVRKLAPKFNLSTSETLESQEICFVPKAINDFLKKYLKPEPGRIVDIRGKIIGRHQGLHFYTIGQRKGIGLSEGPYYVLDKNLKKNQLIVTKDEKDLLRKEIIIRNINWVSGVEPKIPLKIKVKIRYRHEPATAILTKNLKSKILNLKFARSQRAITPGQSVVFYRGDETLGGGIIC